MRSVTTKPPTTLIVPRTTPSAARTRMKSADSSSNAVSSIGLRVLLLARGSGRIGLGWFRCRRRFGLDAQGLRGRLVDDLPAVGDGRALGDLVVQVELELAVLDE